MANRKGEVANRKWEAGDGDDGGHVDACYGRATSAVAATTARPAAGVTGTQAGTTLGPGVAAAAKKARLPRGHFDDPEVSPWSSSQGGPSDHSDGEGDFWGFEP